MLYWLKLILISDQDLALFWQKQILTGLLVAKNYKNRTMKISLFNYSMLGYISILIYILLQAFQNLSRLLIMISELITDLKYTFNIPFRINLKTIIMGTSSQFNDGTQLAKTLPTLSSEILYTPGLGWRNLYQGLELAFTVLNNNGNLNVKFN